MNETEKYKSEDLPPVKWNHINQNSNNLTKCQNKHSKAVVRDTDNHFKENYSDNLKMSRNDNENQYNAAQSSPTAESPYTYDITCDISF